MPRLSLDPTRKKGRPGSLLETLGSEGWGHVLYVASESDRGVTRIRVRCRSKRPGPPRKSRVSQRRLSCRPRHPISVPVAGRRVGELRNPCEDVAQSSRIDPQRPEPLLSRSAWSPGSAKVRRGCRSSRRRAGSAAPQSRGWSSPDFRGPAPPHAHCCQVCGYARQREEIGGRGRACIVRTRPRRL